MKGKKIQKQTVKKNLPRQAKTSPVEMWKIYLALAVILVISALIYLPVLNNNLLSWDDERYIKDNPLVHSINLKDIFSQYVMGNYHPLTILTFAIEYKFFGLNPDGYHAVNLFIHLLNTCLVFYAIYLLSEKYGIALVAALLFGIHPLHVESVAWAAELKDLLYTFFFLASWIFYLKYLKDFQKKFIVIALLLFLLSLLSKAMAASLPVVLILTDYFKERKINFKSLIEKVPFFVLAIILGIVAVSAQKSEGATDVIQFPFYQQVIFSSYGFILYLVKLILPLNLSAYYPYPIRNGEAFPSQYFIYLLLLMGLLAFLFYSLRYSRKLFFGIGFFAITVFLVLQLFPVGGAIIADRYSYIPSIGIFYLAGEGFIFLWNRKMKLIAPLLLTLFTLFFSVTTFSRTKVWNTNLSLWDDAISKYQTISQAYHNRGLALVDANRKEEAMKDLTKAIELNPNRSNAYNSRGSLLMNIGRTEEAINDLNKAIELKPEEAAPYVNRGTAKMNLNKLEEAIKDFNKAIEIDPNLSVAYYSRALVYKRMAKDDMAIADYTTAILKNANYIEAYVNRGNIFRDMNRIDEAVADYNKAILINPAFPIAYFGRATLFMNDKKYEEAINDYTKAIELNKDYFQAYYNRGLAKYNSGKKDEACTDMKKAESLGYQQATGFIINICK